MNTLRYLNLVFASVYCKIYQVTIPLVSTRNVNDLDRFAFLINIRFLC